MKHRKITGFLVILLLAIIGGFYGYHQGIISLLQPKPNLSEVKNVTDASNQFALDYYAKLIGKDDGNIFFSPFSISAAFVMTYEGAKEQTAEQIRSVFYFPDNIDLIRKEYKAIFSEINKKNKGYELNSANALWAQQDYKFSREYFNNIEKYYDGKATNLDFVNNPEGSASTINEWVENQTKNKIKNLIDPSTINKLTRLMLTNAVYFKGEWVKKFDKKDTKEEDFKISENDIVKTPMMRFTDNDAIFNYGENDDLQILEMPYSGDDLSALFILPKNNDLSKLESKISNNNLLGWKKDMREQKVKIYIPRFKFETEYKMKEDLTDMGMATAFTNSADFSGMTASGKDELKIDEAIHKAYIDVYEEGTEAAAATVIVMEEKSAPPKETKIPVFRADHPFIFVIQHKNTGNILFIGRVVNPNL